MTLSVTWLMFSCVSSRWFSGLAGPFVVACPSASAATELAQLLWPPAAAQTDKPPSKLAKAVGTSDLLQIVPLVLLPEATAAATGKAPSGSLSRAPLGTSSSDCSLHVGLDLISEVLEGSRAEGFSLAGLSTVRPAGSSSLSSAHTPGDCLPKGLKLSQAQSQVMKAALAKSTVSAAINGASGQSSSDGRHPRVYAGTPAVALALSRENAAAYLPMRMQQLSKASLPSDNASTRIRPQGLAAAAAAGAAAPVPGSRMAVEEVLLHFFDVFPSSSGYLVTSSP